jgi:CelD/BcsL family acetyltransferase involved in cellulose biosynthesis
MSVSYRLISADQLDRAQIDAWRAIQAGERRFESPYFCPEFTQEVARARDDVRITVIENAGCPAGFFPHQRSAFGVGRPVGGPLSDYHGVVAAPSSEWTLRDLMRASKLSLWSFDHLVAGDSRLDPYVTARATSPQADLGEGYDTYLAERRAASDQIVQAERKARKLARELGTPEFALHDPQPDALDLLIGWKRAQYLRSGITDVFAAPWTGELLRRLVSVQTSDFAGVCSTLRVGGRVVAAHMGMRSRHVLHYWFPAYDPDYAKYSVGLVLLLRLAKAMADVGVRAIDFGKGDDRYKQAAMTGAVELSEGVVEVPSLASAARRARRGLEAWVRRTPLAGIARVPGRWLTRLERRGRFR